MVKMLELAREAHVAELQRKQELTDALSFPAGLLAALTAALMTMVTSISLPLSAWETALLFLAALAVVPGIYALFYLARARLAHIYFYPAKISAVRDWRDSVLATGRSDDQTDELIDRYLLDEYVKCASHNSDNNDLRSAQIFAANQGLLAMLVLVALAGLPFLLNRVQESHLPEQAVATMFIGAA